jgi:hypothetical protein
VPLKEVLEGKENGGVVSSRHKTGGRRCCQGHQKEYNYRRKLLKEQGG